MLLDSGGSPKSVVFILWGPWICPHVAMAIQFKVVMMFQPGTQRWTDQPIYITFPKAMLILTTKINASLQCVPAVHCVYDEKAHCKLLTGFLQVWACQLWNNHIYFCPGPRLVMSRERLPHIGSSGSKTKGDPLMTHSPLQLQGLLCCWSICTSMLWRLQYYFLMISKCIVYFLIFKI